MTPLPLLDGAGRPARRLRQFFGFFRVRRDEGPLVARLLRRPRRVQGSRQALHFVQLYSIVDLFTHRP